MRKTLTLLSCGFLLSVTVPAFAKAGPYISLEAGQANVNTIYMGNSNGFAGRVASGYLFGDSAFNYGVEAGALLYPHLSGEHSVFGLTNWNETDSGFNLELLAVAKYTFASQIILFSKLGPAYIHQSQTNSYAYNDTTHSNINALGVEGALGTGYQLTPDTAVTLTASLLVTNGRSDPIGSVLVGVTHSF